MTIEEILYPGGRFDNTEYIRRPSTFTPGAIERLQEKYKTLNERPAQGADEDLRRSQMSDIQRDIEGRKGSLTLFKPTYVALHTTQPRLSGVMRRMAQ